MMAASPGARKRPRPKTGLNHLVAGTSAGLISSIALYPLDLVKVRLQAAQGRGFAPMIGMLSQIVRTEGWTALYRGLAPSLVGALWKGSPSSVSPMCLY